MKHASFNTAGDRARRRDARDQRFAGVVKKRILRKLRMTVENSFDSFERKKKGRFRALLFFQGLFHSPFINVCLRRPVFCSGAVCFAFDGNAAAYEFAAQTHGIPKKNRSGHTKTAGRIDVERIVIDEKAFPRCQ